MRGDVNTKSFRNGEAPPRSAEHFAVPLTKSTDPVAFFCASADQSYRMGAPSAESLSWPVALISAPPGTCALIELRSIHASPDVAISKSSLPTACPLIVMRSFPLSLANMDGAPAGFGALAEDAGEEGPKARRLKSKIPTRSGPAFHFLAGDAAKTPPA